MSKALSNYKVWMPAAIFAAIIIFLAVELAFDPGPPANPTTPAAHSTK